MQQLNLPSRQPLSDAEELWVFNVTRQGAMSYSTNTRVVDAFEKQFPGRSISETTVSRIRRSAQPRTGLKGTGRPTPGLHMTTAEAMSVITAWVAAGGMDVKAVAGNSELGEAVQGAQAAEAVAEAAPVPPPVPEPPLVPEPHAGIRRERQGEAEGAQTEAAAEAAPVLEPQAGTRPGRPKDPNSKRAQKEAKKQADEERARRTQPTLLSFFAKKAVEPASPPPE
jgi:hypothetical protein